MNIRKRTLLFKLALFFLSFIVALIIGEIYVRIAVREPIPMYIPSKLEKLVFELNPDYPSINSFGIRGKDFKLEDLEGKYIIAAIGDSHTFSGATKNVKDAFPQRLECHLNNLLGRDVARVLNFGVPGYNTAQELELLKSKVLKFHPHLVILQYDINDTHVCNYIQPKCKFLNFLIYRSKLIVFLSTRILYTLFSNRAFFEFVGKHFPDALLFQEGLVGTLSSDVEGEEQVHRGHPARTKDRVPQRYYYMIGEDNWKGHIHEFAELAKREKIPILATGLIGQEERKVFVREGFHVYSFYGIFKNVDTRLYGYDPNLTYTHFDVRGCNIIGMALAYFVKEEFLTNN